MSMKFQRRSSHVCVCGRDKENVKQRYCNECQKFHGTVGSLAHTGKGCGPRRKGWNARYMYEYIQM